MLDILCYDFEENARYSRAFVKKYEYSHYSSIS